MILCVCNVDFLVNLGIFILLLELELELLFDLFLRLNNVFMLERIFVLFVCYLVKLLFKGLFMIGLFFFFLR